MLRLRRWRSKFCHRRPSEAHLIEHADVRSLQNFKKISLWKKYSGVITGRTPYPAIQTKEIFRKLQCHGISVRLVVLISVPEGSNVPT